MVHFEHHTKETLKHFSELTQNTFYVDRSKVLGYDFFFQVGIGPLKSILQITSEKIAGLLFRGIRRSFFPIPYVFQGAYCNIFENQEGL